MDYSRVDELVSEVIAKAGPERESLDSALDFTLDFAVTHSVPPEMLLELAAVCEQQGMYREEYVFAKACARLGSGKTRENAFFITGVMAYLMGYLEEAEY